MVLETLLEHPRRLIIIRTLQVKLQQGKQGVATLSMAQRLCRIDARTFLRLVVTLHNIMAVQRREATQLGPKGRRLPANEVQEGQKSTLNE